MSDSKHTEVVQTEGPISSYVRVESMVLSTASADAYRAYDLSQKQSCCLWIGREVFPSGAEDILRFLQRFEQIDAIEPSLCVISGYGVDSDGRPFALFPPLDGYKVSGGNLEGAESERRFSSCLRLAAALHESGVSCGDICPDSFWVTRDGQLLFVGLMGMLAKQPTEIVKAAPQATIPFIAPELFSDGEVTAASDVFSLGVLAYHLLTKQYPFGAEGFKAESPAPYTPVGNHMGNPPVWVEPLFEKCFAVDPAERYQDAPEMLKALREIRARVSADESMPTVRDAKANVPKLASDLSPDIRPGSDLPVPTEQPDQSAVPTSQLVILGVLALLIASLVALFVFPLFSPDKDIEMTGRLEEGLEPLIDAVSDDPLADDIGGLADPKTGLSEKKQFLERMASSNDPIAHSALITSAKEAPNAEFRSASERALLQRSTRLGLLRASEQTRQWLRTLRVKDYPPSYEPILQVLDNALPEKERDAAIRRAYSSNPQVALRVAAALAFDLEKLKEFQPLLSQLIGDSLRLEDANEHAAISLIMAHQDLSVVFGEDVLQYRAEVPDNDITWLLRRLASQRDIHVRAIANLALERNIVSPIRKMFLEIVRDRADLPASIVTALIRGAAGNLSEEDIASFGRWYDVQAEEILLAAMVDIKEPKLSRQAIEALAAKSIVQEPAASLISWIKHSYWDEREKFSQLIGVFGNLERVNEETLSKNIALLDTFVRDSDLLDILIDTNHPIVVRTVVTKYSDILGLGTLLTLLSNRDKTVRIEAVRALKDFNDLGALKIIIDHYEEEKDQDVREVYKETFWVIKKRDGQKGLFGQ